MTPERLKELKVRYSFLLAHAESFFFYGEKAIANYFLRLNKDVTEMLEEIERRQNERDLAESPRLKGNTMSKSKSNWIESLDDAAEGIGDFLGSKFLNKNFPTGGAMLRKYFETVLSATKLSRAVELAARDLPAGSRITIKIEQNCATIEVTDVDRRLAVFDVVDTLPDTFLAALEYAIARELPEANPSNSNGVE